MAIVPTSGLSVADISLTTPNKTTIILGDRIKVPTVVILSRYFG